MTELEQSSIRVGEPAPDFALRSSGNGVVKLSGFRGKKIVLVFLRHLG